MPIDSLTLMEMFTETFSDHAVGPSQDLIGQQDHLTESTLFEAPSQELVVEPISLANLIGDAPSLMQALVRSVKENGDERVATVLTKIEFILETSRDDLADQDTRVRRLLDFVYPVV